MSELNEVREPESLSEAIKIGYDSIFGKQWPIWVGGILFGMINVFMFAFERPWSSANGIRNWGNWFFNSLDVTDITIISPHLFSTSLLNFGIIAGAFASAIARGRRPLHCRSPSQEPNSWTAAPHLERPRGLKASCFPQWRPLMLGSLAIKPTCFP